MLCHGFTTESPFLQARVTLPSIERARLGWAGTLADGVTSSLRSRLRRHRHDRDEVACSAKGVREQIAFYGSSDAGSHGRVSSTTAGATCSPGAQRAVEAGRWSRWASPSDDDILGTSQPSAVSPPRDRRSCTKRHGDAVHRLSFYVPTSAAPSTRLPSSRQAQGHLSDYRRFARAAAARRPADEPRAAITPGSAPSRKAGPSGS